MSKGAAAMKSEALPLVAEALPWVIFLGLLGLTFYLVNEYVVVPASFYPANWWDKFASFVDNVFYGVPKIGKVMTDPMQKVIDDALAKVALAMNGSLFDDPSHRSPAPDPSVDANNYGPGPDVKTGSN